MKQRGFTLIELLGVISVLAILALIVASPVTKLIRDSNQKACESQVSSIILAAKLWGSDHKVNLPEVVGTFSIITINNLKTEGYLDNDVKNPKTGELLSNDQKIKIVKTGEKHWNYTLVGTDGNTSLDICK